MFKRIFKIIAERTAERKERTKAYEAHAAHVRDEIRIIENETKIIRAQTAELMRQTEQDKIKDFHKHAARIEKIKNPKLREKAMRSLLESSMGKAARRHFH